MSYFYYVADFENFKEWKDLISKEENTLSFGINGFKWVSIKDIVYIYIKQSKELHSSTFKYKTEVLEKNNDDKTLKLKLVGSADNPLTLTEYKEIAGFTKSSTGVSQGRFVEFKEEKEYVRLEIESRFDGNSKKATGVNQNKSGIKKIFSTSNNKGENIIFYGIPGCGKSYQINNKVLLNDQSERIDEDFIKRIVFHPEYTYTDFIGQITPKTNEGQISFVATLGPFTEILKKALCNPKYDYYLIIEELNRGNAPAIFGDLFQLLDRSNHESEYSIDNPFIQSELQICKVYLPKNLYIYATLNTSDQNVFTLDTAFKRRWQFNYISNDIENADHKDYLIPQPESAISKTWEDFIKEINKKIVQSKKTNNSFDDKQMGAYFIKKGDNILINPTETITHNVRNERIEKFVYKVLEYIWNDVSKYNKDDWFKQIDSFDDLLSKYKKNGLSVFNI